MWDYMCTFGAMGFNKAHAVAYGMVSYWSCYLKAHFPLEYAAAALDAESEPATQLILLRELNKEGIGYIPVDAKRSTDRWEVAERDGRKVLVGPLTNIKGIGPKFLEQILHARRTGQEVKGALATKLANAETEIDSLTPVADALEEIGLANKKVVSRYVPIGEVAAGHGQTMIIGSIRSLDPTDLNNPVKLSKRGYALSGPALALNLILGDDTGEIACHVGRDIYEKIGIPMLEAGRVGKSIYAIKGSVVEGFRLFGVKEVRYIGDLEEVKKRKRDAANGDRHGNDRPKRGRSDNRDRVRGDTGREGGSVRVHAGETDSSDLPWS
jgi:hypothetical protein